LRESFEILELPESLTASVDNTKSLQIIDLYLTHKNGQSYNYHPTEEEQLEQRAQQEADQLKIAEKKQRELDSQTALAKKTQAANDSETERRRMSVALEENLLLEASCQPLRSYLMQNVIPALVDGLLDVCRVRPEDPVDYLAEYLFHYAVDEPLDLENRQQLDSKLPNM
jgi:adenylate kinase